MADVLEIGRLEVKLNRACVKNEDDCMGPDLDAIPALARRCLDCFVTAATESQEAAREAMLDDLLRGVTDEWILAYMKRRQALRQQGGE